MTKIAPYVCATLENYISLQALIMRIYTVHKQGQTVHRLQNATF